MCAVGVETGGGELLGGAFIEGWVGGVTVIDCNIAVPCPVKLTDWGLLVALWVMVSNPVRVPVAVGVKVTLMVQLLFPARVRAASGAGLRIVSGESQRR